MMYENFYGHMDTYLQDEQKRAHAVCNVLEEILEVASTPRIHPILQHPCDGWGVALLAYPHSRLSVERRSHGFSQQSPPPELSQRTATMIAKI